MVESSGPALSPGFHRFHTLAVHQFLPVGELVVVVGGMGQVQPVLIEICGIWCSWEICPIYSLPL